MNRKVIELVILGAIVLNAPQTRALAQEWGWVAPIPTGDHFNTMSFVDSLQGWLSAGGSGFVVHTSNGGKTWEYQNTGLRIYYHDAVFKDKFQGWVVGGSFSGVILRTSDGGETWVETSPDTVHRGVRNLKRIGTDTLFAGTEDNVVLKSTNGGVSWRGVRAVQRYGVAAIFFLNSSFGFALGDNLYKTSDGGDTWIQAGAIRGSLGESDMYFSDSARGVLADGTTGISRTLDGGRTWMTVAPAVSMKSLSFVTPARGWAFGLDGIYCTTDSGNSWRKQSALSMEKGEMLSDHLGYACGGFGFVYRTTDGGGAWNEISIHPTTATLWGVEVGDSGQVWVAGDSAYRAGEILFSPDGGQTWTKQVRSSSIYFRSIRFQGSNLGWACGTSGGVLHTSNGGAEWSPMMMSTKTDLYDILFVTPNQGWCCGDSVIHSTTNGGIDWTTYYVPEGSQMRSLCFVDSQRGWAAGGDLNSNKGIIYHTSDGGVSWSRQFVGTVNPLLSIAFGDPLHGCAVGDTILLTSDGGSNWFPHPRPDFTTFSSVRVLYNDEYLMTSYSGQIFRTTDGGNLWMQQETPTSMNLLNITRSTEGVYYAVGGLGSVLKRNSLINGIAEDRQSYHEFGFKLDQNFPNPFNSGTIIRYELFRPAARVTLMIFNVLGQRERVLVDQSQQSGAHELYWDGCDEKGQSLPSGAYFYVIRIDRGRDVKRMLLLH